MTWSRATHGAVLALLLAGAGGCGRAAHNVDGAASAASGGGDNEGGTGAGPNGGDATDCCARGDCPCAGQAPVSAATVPMHRLRNSEYRNSLRDLLGVDATSPVADTERPYDAVIDDAGPWIVAASTIAHQLLDKPPSTAPFACVPAAGAVQRTCAESLLADFGLQAFRRPLLDAEKVAFLRVFDDLSKTDDSRMALEQMLRALLLSPAFLFHVELSDDPDGSQPEPLDSYALAARLSFALWRTTPDPVLLDAARAGLSDDAVLAAAYDRLAGNERIRELADGLGDVWLGVEQLTTHEVDPEVFPSFTYPDRVIMLDAEHDFLRTFLKPAQPLRELLTLETGDRVGLLGQAALLTVTSNARRTAPLSRGKFVLEKLLCQPPPPGPPKTSGLLGADYPPGKSERAALEDVAAGADCQACHAQMSPFGYALNEYDALGQFRSVDAQGQPIDARARLPESLFPGGVALSGLSQLARALSQSPRFSSCTAQQVASYLVHRELTEATDPELVAELSGVFDAGAPLDSVTRAVVMSDAFRYRRAP